MDHSYIDEHNIIARYEMGKLSSEECAGFEVHFLDCLRCSEQLELTRDFRQALKTVAAEDGARTLSTAPARPVQAAPIGKPALIAIAVCVVIFAAPAFLLLQQMRLVHAELNQAKTDAEAWHRQYTEQQQASAELEKQLHETEQKNQPNRASSGASSGLPVMASIFALETVRSGDLGASEPVNHVVSSRSSQSVVLSVDRDDLQGLQNYHATLTDSQGRVLWRLGPFGTASSTPLGITVPSNLLRDGVYLLTLEGRSRQGGSVISRRYPFRVKFK